MVSWSSVRRAATAGALLSAFVIPAAPAGATAVDPPSAECTARTAPISQAPATLSSETVMPGTDGRLLHVILNSPAMGTTVNNYVLLPPGYNPTAKTRYPVLYLLHGADGSYKDWVDNGVQSLIDTESAADQLKPFITVMPDGGLWGFYSDWYGSDLDGDTPNPPPAYATYDIHELIPWIDQNFRARTARRYRSIAGLSMGGFGTMSYASRYPDLFSVAGSFSGAVDIDADYPAGSEGLNALSPIFTDAPPEECVWGDAVTDNVNWRTVDPTYLASNLSNTSLFVASGDGEPGPYDTTSTYADGSVEAVIWYMNQQFTDALGNAGIPYTSYFYGAGTHSWPYWLRDLQHFLPLMENAFAHPVATPPEVPFNYRTDLSDFTVWGWQFATDHPATEFTYLEGVDRAKLEAIGSGTLTVTTPRLYKRDRDYTITVSDSSGSAASQTVPSTSIPAQAVSTVKSSATGTLTFAVDLGTGHDVQQLTFNSNDAPPARWTHAVVSIRPS
jgi:S-formylglutathione hydrolase FrmB